MAPLQIASAVSYGTSNHSFQVSLRDLKARSYPLEALAVTAIGVQHRSSAFMAVPPLDLTSVPFRACERHSLIRNPACSIRRVIRPSWTAVHGAS
ncbi:hypothetical protein NOVOSPHI9U_420487 [Novosphingobium sp. 9U]|nr:hypothetical protein NOVOSPHI9U_420487 [Novosphingobium sp. 9U]